ncbi:hypothetical protein J008_04418 [Cryptococcus neoformans]|nr:hypothetical protein C362_03949 [Cryptococcus neoformans var. grubii Bt1]OXC67397.1 hypothetical protein AYX13_04118 [Cryptococcus neoformans var. grubii]OXG14490.1 hypothetical protein C366_04531 [Cryptococcus neoformans var. grubii Tu401-1]OXG20212.1 hypothetical protein C367_04361 [Cryptococcus neoformans var. grubii Ze90-1]OXM77577.1 hypothetical protein C364_04515 [Cryptococcus neoformans var. grubii Bt63]
MSPFLPHYVPMPDCLSFLTMTLPRPTRHSDSNSSSPVQQQRRSFMPTTPICFAASSLRDRRSAFSHYFTTPYQTTMGRTSRSVSFNGPSHVRLYDVIGNESAANRWIN